MDVRLLWFRCKNPDCKYIPNMTRKQKRALMSIGQSQQSYARRLRFMRYVQGHILYRNNRDTVIFSTKYGDILLYDANPNAIIHDADHPIHDAEMCNRCLERLNNDKVLFPI